MQREGGREGERERELIVGSTVTYICTRVLLPLCQTKTETTDAGGTRHYRPTGASYSDTLPYHGNSFTSFSRTFPFLPQAM